MNRITFSIVVAAIIASLVAFRNAHGEVIATWSFPDQGTTANADLSATTNHANASVGPIVVSGHIPTFQNVASVEYSYIDATQNGGVATQSGGGESGNGVAYYMVGDWNDGGTGGNIQQDRAGTNHTVNPSGTGPSGAGALYLDSDGEGKNSISEAISNNLFFTFDVTANGGDWEVTNFSFYGTRDSVSPERAWQSWHLQADTGSGFSTVFSSAADAIPGNETWGLVAADPFSVTIPDGQTATFRVLGTTVDTSTFGRETAFDDLMLEGTFSPIPEPSTWLLLVMGLIGMQLTRRLSSDNVR